MLFFRATTLISRGKSHISPVRGLVVRCLLFNSEVSCSNPWVCACLFTSIPKQTVLTFFGTMRLFGFVRLFFRNFFNVPKESSFQFFFRYFATERMVKIPKGPFFQNFRHHETAIKISHFLSFFRKFFIKDSKDSPFNFLKFCNSVRKSNSGLGESFNSNWKLSRKKGCFSELANSLEVTVYFSLRFALSARVFQKLQVME